MTRVLLVEDHRDVAKVMVEALTGRGLDVAHVTDAHQAFEILDVAREEFDFLVTDYDLGRDSPTGLALIDQYLGDGVTVLFSGLDRQREIAAECKIRRPDHVLFKERLPELIDLIAAG